MSEDKMREVVEFLCGTGELCGVTFGDIPDGESGKYWWRKHLRSALTALPHQVKSEDARDAARYRWLKENAVQNSHEPEALYLAVPHSIKFGAISWSDDIDAAISAQENKS